MAFASVKINGKMLAEAIRAKDLSVASFARRIKASRESVARWLPHELVGINGDLWRIAVEVLELTPAQIGKIKVESIGVSDHQRYRLSIARNDQRRAAKKKPGKHA